MDQLEQFQAEAAARESGQEAAKQSDSGQTPQQGSAQTLGASTEPARDPLQVQDAWAGKRLGVPQSPFG
eukprot:9767446-Alexandrium_andersonii.AAC.1